MPSTPPPACRVCCHPVTMPFLAVRGRRYLRCPLCEATFLDPAQLPDEHTETARYRLHQNVPDDPAYRSFLNRLAIPLQAMLPPGSKGLDYGCGPGPALSHMLTEASHAMAHFDPLFFPDPEPLKQTYDFITCSEVAEHFHHPAKELDKLNQLLRPGGFIGFMTRFQTNDSTFANWSYRRDITHVTFYRERTFRVVAQQHGWMCNVPARDVVIMQKMLFVHPLPGLSDNLRGN